MADETYTLTQLQNLKRQLETGGTLTRRDMRRIINTALVRSLEPTKVTQRPNGCWAACIATITGIPLDEFPELPDAARDEAWWDENGTRLRNEITVVLRKHGWRKESTWTDAPRGFAMAYGTSPRGHQHGVVVLDGKLWHDPHPSQAGLLDVQQFEILVPIVGKAAGPLVFERAEANRA